jgi:parvulin-like peptidyl-prolyl isomerase
MADAVFELKPDDGRWHGPIESAYGYHLVLLTKRADGFYPPLDEIVDTVREDALRLALVRANDRAVQAIIDTYDVRMDLGPGGD